MSHSRKVKECLDTEGTGPHDMWLDSLNVAAAAVGARPEAVFGARGALWARGGGLAGF